MPKSQIKFVSDGALEYFKANTDFVTEKLIDNPLDNQWVRSCVEGELFVPKKYEYEVFALEIPKYPGDFEADLKNGIILYNSFKHLPSYVIADERFWLWVSLDIAYEASIASMEIKHGSSVFKDHWLFTQGKRRGQFFGVLSRLYHRVAYTFDPDSSDPYELSKFVFQKPFRFRELSWRTFSNDKQIVLAAIRAEKKIVDKYRLEDKSYYYTELAKRISQAGSVRLLDTYNPLEMEHLIYGLFTSILEEEASDK